VGELAFEIAVEVEDLDAAVARIAASRRRG
jgi:hypothetical protein